MLVHAPAKLNLCLYLGPRRGDGLHELCSLFEPLALADPIEVSEARARRGRSARASRARTSPPGRWRRCASGAGSTRRCGSRSRSGSRSPPAWAAAAPTPPRSCASPPARSTTSPPLAAEIGADVPSQLVPALALVEGAGERVERLPEPAPHAVVLLPGGGGLEHRGGLRRGRPARARPRRAASWSELADRLRAAAGAGASPLAYPELLANDLEPAARSLRPEIGDALDALRDAGAPARPAHRLRPHRLRPLRRPRRRPRRRRRASTATTRSSARLGGRREAAGRARRQPQTAGPGDRRGRGRSLGYYLLSRQLGHLDLHRLLEEISNTLGAWTYLLVGVFAFAEIGAFVGLVVPGETVMLLGGAVAGQGAIDIYLLIAIAWFAAWAGDTTSFFIGRRLGREFVLRHGPRFGVSHERFEQVEDYFSRHGGKTIFIGRFVSLRARLRAVHRRQLGDALPRLRPLQHPRLRALRQRPHPDRLRLLAQHRHRRQVRGQRRLPARRADRRRRRGGRPLPPLPGRRRTAAPRCAGWSATRRPAGSSPSAGASSPSSASSGTGSPRAAPSGWSSPR